MTNHVKRYSFVCDIDNGVYVRDDDYDALRAENERLVSQVAMLQSAENSWQSGYDKGRSDGTRHRQSEIAQLSAELDAVRAVLDSIGGLSRALRVGGPDPMDLQGLSDALEEAVNMAHNALHCRPAAEIAPEVLQAEHQCPRCAHGTEPWMCGAFAIHPTSYSGSPHPGDLCNWCGHTRACHSAQPALAAHRAQQGGEHE